MVNTARVNADHGRDFHPLAEHTTTLNNFIKGEIREFLAFPFSLDLKFDRTLSKLVVCLVISHKNYIQKLHKRASILQWILGRFDFSQNEFEMKIELRRDL